MQIPAGAFIAVVDGEKLNLFQNTSEDGSPTLTTMSVPSVDSANAGSGTRHHSSSANPDHSQQGEDGFAAGVAEMLNGQVLAGHIGKLIVIAAPRTLGEMRKHYHKALSSTVIGEIAKDLTGHGLHDIENADSDEAGHGFRLKAATCSDRSRPGCGVGLRAV